MTTASPELVAILKRWVNATVSGDARTVRNLLSRDLSATYVGSSRNEFISGRDLQDTIEAHIGEIRNLAVDDPELIAHDFGDSGWAVFQCTLRHRETGNTTHWRVSIVFRLEEGIWKAHHVHSSFSNDDHKVMSVDHNAFNDLVHSARNIDLNVGRSGSATVMFTDIVGSSTLAEAIGDARWTRLVNAHVDELGGAISAAEGRLIKSLGDGTMSTFASAGSAMRAAQRIQRTLAAQTEEPRLRNRIGLHTGDVIEAGDDFFGTVVYKAARVATAAAPDEILVSDATRVMIGGAQDFIFGDSTEVQLKGFEGSHMVHCLTWQT